MGGKVGEQSKCKPAVKERMEGYPTKYSFRIYIYIYIIYLRCIHTYIIYIHTYVVDNWFLGGKDNDTMFHVYLQQHHLNGQSLVCVSATVRCTEFLLKHNQSFYGCGIQKSKLGTTTGHSYKLYQLIYIYIYKLNVQKPGAPIRWTNYYLHPWEPTNLTNHPRVFDCAQELHVDFGGFCHHFQAYEEPPRWKKQRPPNILAW